MKKKKPKSDIERIKAERDRLYRELLALSDKVKGIELAMMQIDMSVTE